MQRVLQPALNHCSCYNVAYFLNLCNAAKWPSSTTGSQSGLAYNSLVMNNTLTSTFASWNDIIIKPRRPIHRATCGDRPGGAARPTAAQPGNLHNIYLTLWFSGDQFFPQVLQLLFKHRQRMFNLLVLASSQTTTSTGAGKA